MSIRIDKITRGRFGNKILQYNNLMQLSKNLNIKSSCCSFQEEKYFKNICNFEKSIKPVKDLTYEMILNDSKLNFNKFNYKIDDPNYLLHNVFFKITKQDPRIFIELKDKYKIKLSNNKIHVGIHIRGGDKIKKVPREIHYENYYIDAINYLINQKFEKTLIFYICTDDNTFKVFKNVVKYLQSKKLNYLLSQDTMKNKNDKESNNNFIYDFSTLTECDYIICSSSTFPLSAFFLGKKNKKLILSKIWINKNINHTKWGHDKMPKSFWLGFNNFWIELAKGGNDYLKPWLII